MTREKLKTLVEIKDTIDGLEETKKEMDKNHWVKIVTPNNELYINSAMYDRLNNDLYGILIDLKMRFEEM